MATKSTKKPVRKTKTSAKTAVRKVSANKAVKATKKTVTKASAGAEIKSAQTNRAVKSIDKFRLLHGLGGLAFLAQAILVAALGNAYSLAVTSNYLTGDALTEGRPLEPASRELFDVRMAWLVAAFLGVAAVYHLLIATVLYARYQKVVNNGINRWRLIEFSVASGLVLLSAALLIGVRDIGSLIMLVALNTGVHVINYMFESGGIAKYPRLLSSLVSGLIASITVVLGWYVVSGLRYGSADFNSYLHWLIAAGIVSFGLFSYVCLARYRKRGRFADFGYTEKAYAILSLLAKSAVAWIIFFGFLK